MYSRFLQVLIMVEAIWLSNLVKGSHGRKYLDRFLYISILFQMTKTLVHFGMMPKTRLTLIMFRNVLSVKQFWTVIHPTCFQMSLEVEHWPYDFPASNDFQSTHQRGTVRGRLLVQDR